MTVADVSVVIAGYLPEPHAGLMSGMLFGVRQSLSADLYQNLIDSGTLHIVALSGTNITILISLVSAACIRVFSRRIASVFATGIIIGFVWFVGPSPSVVRAAIMGCLALIAGVAGRQVWALWSLFLTAVAMLAFRPGLLTDISFQLSAGATLGLILFGRPVPKTPVSSAVAEAQPPASGLIRVFLDAVRSDMRITMSAQVFTIPLTVLYFRRLSLVSPVANLMIGWVLPPLTGAGIMFAGAAFVIPPLATPVSWILWLGLEYVIRVVNIASGIPFSSVSW